MMSFLGRPTKDLQSFHQDVNKLLNDIDRPLNEDELSGDENELLVSSIMRSFSLYLYLADMFFRTN